MKPYAKLIARLKNPDDIDAQMIREMLEALTTHPDFLEMRRYEILNQFYKQVSR